MIRLYSDKAIGALMAQYRIALTAEKAEAVEAIHTGDCDHRANRPACAKCAERRTVMAAAAVIRAPAGMQRRGTP